jgi:hypothetical protein
MTSATVAAAVLKPLQGFVMKTGKTFHFSAL